MASSVQLIAPATLAVPGGRGGPPGLERQIAVWPPQPSLWRYPSCSWFMA